jgi:hypothetical protein
MAKITKRIVDAAAPRERDYVIWDDELPDFGLRVFTSGKRSYVIQYRAAGRSRRYTIGLHGVWTPDTARQEAKIQFGRVASATARATVVLPIPPGPTSDTSRCCPSAAIAAATAVSRPIMRASGVGRLWRLGSDGAGGGPSDDASATPATKR